MQAALFRINVSNLLPVADRTGFAEIEGERAESRVLKRRNNSDSDPACFQLPFPMKHDKYILFILTHKTTPHSCVGYYCCTAVTWKGALLPSSCVFVVCMFVLLSSFRLFESPRHKHPDRGLLASIQPSDIWLLFFCVFSATTQRRNYHAVCCGHGGSLAALHRSRTGTTTRSRRTHTRACRGDISLP